jgi:uncharacterized protein (TIGR00661 family)
MERPESMKRKRILIAPLDWGLGHATRCVPLIRKFMNEGYEVILCGSGRSSQFLLSEFPDLEFVSSPSFTIRYSAFFPQWLYIVLQGPAFLYSVYREHRWLKKFIADRKPDMVLSDNRYGLYSSKVKSVLISHQLMIKTPAGTGEALLHRFISHFVNRFDECLIPDVEGENNLSGDLSHKYPLPSRARFIGWLSRFSPAESDHQASEKKWDICISLSGPEPMRTKLEEKFRRLENRDGYRIILIQGKPGETFHEVTSNGIHVFNHLDDQEMRKALLGSSLLICRSGYSSLMDLKVLGRSAVLIPTPGQTEQEYLAQYLSRKGIFSMMKQDYPLKDFRDLKDRGILLPELSAY